MVNCYELLVNQCLGLVVWWFVGGNNPFNMGIPYEFQTTNLKHQFTPWEFDVFLVSLGVRWLLVGTGVIT